MIPDRHPRFKVVKRRTMGSAIIDGRSRYGLKYIPGTKVFAPKGTLGIFTFKTAGAANDWADVWNRYHVWNENLKDLIVIPVIPLGRGKKIIFAASDITTYGLDSYYSDDEDGYYDIGEAPDYTYAYPGVYVIR